MEAIKAQREENEMYSEEQAELERIRSADMEDTDQFLKRMSAEKIGDQDSEDDYSEDKEDGTKTAGQLKTVGEATETNVLSSAVGTAGLKDLQS